MPGNVTLVESPPLEITKRYVDARWEDDFETAYALLDPDVDVLTPRGSTIRGADTLRAGWEEGEEYEYLKYTIDSQEFDQHDGVVTATTCVTWRWKTTGEVAYSSRIEGDYSFRDGRIARVEMRIEHQAQE